MKSVEKYIRHGVWNKVDNQVYHDSDHSPSQCNDRVWYQLLRWEETVTTCVEANIQNRVMGLIR